MTVAGNLPNTNHFNFSQILDPEDSRWELGFASKGDPSPERKAPNTLHFLWWTKDRKQEMQAIEGEKDGESLVQISRRPERKESGRVLGEISMELPFSL